MLANRLYKRSAQLLLINNSKLSPGIFWWQSNANNIMYTRSYVANATNATNLNVIHDQKRSEFFITLNGKEKAFIQYRKEGSLMKLEETQVPDVFSGKGVGGILAKAAFDYCVENNLKMDLICTYLQHYHEKCGNKYKAFIVQKNQ